MIEKIKHIRIKDLDRERLNLWIETEVTSLANDFGQTIDDDMMKHICKRLHYKLTNALKSWHVGTVHAAFQTGLSGGYGNFRKVTVQALFHFLKQAQNQLANKKSVSAEIESEENKHFVPEASKVTLFLIWATKNMICLEYIHPEWNPVKERKISPKIKALADEYFEAKDCGKLAAFQNKLRTKALNYVEI